MQDIQEAKILRAFKYRLEPTSEQLKKLDEVSGILRFVWNKMLSMNIHRLENNQPIMYYNEMNNFVQFLKTTNECNFLKLAPSNALQQTLKQLELAFKDAFDKTLPLKRIPRYKKRYRSTVGIRFPAKIKPSHFVFNDRRVKVPIFQWMKFRSSKNYKLFGEMKNMTLTQSGGHWYVSIQVECLTKIKRSEATSSVGIDLGVNKLVALSSGDYFAPVNSYKQLQEKLAFYQRKLSKKVKFSSNWKKQQFKINRLHANIARIRHDYLHKISYRLCKNHALIVMEDLKIRNMSKSAKGTIDKPGSMVKQKSGLNKSILDQGWGYLKEFIRYKAEWFGCELILVNPKNTSQTCPKCGNIHKDNRLSQSQFKCTDCSYENNADIVGALNVLERGHRSLACGDFSLERLLKQEPVLNEIHLV
jgi:IS605 OrfB family transposase